MPLARGLGRLGRGRARAGLRGTRGISSRGSRPVQGTLFGPNVGRPGQQVLFNPGRPTTARRPPMAPGPRRQIPGQGELFPRGGRPIQGRLNLPPPRTRAGLGRHGKMVAMGVAAGTGIYASTRGSGKPVDPTTGLPSSMYGY